MKTGLTFFIALFLSVSLPSSTAFAGGGNGGGVTLVAGQSVSYGTLPMNLTVQILKPATELEFFPYMGLHLGQVIHQYKMGNCKITFVEKETYKVELGGCTIHVTLPPP